MDFDHQIISRSLNFNEKMVENKMFNRTKTAIISDEGTKKVNHQALLGSISVKLVFYYLSFYKVLLNA